MVAAPDDDTNVAPPGDPPAAEGASSADAPPATLSPTPSATPSATPPVTPTSSAADTSLPPAPAKRKRRISTRTLATFACFLGGGAVGALVIPLFFAATSTPLAPSSSTSPLAAVTSDAPIDGGAPVDAADAQPPVSHVWRVASLTQTTGLEVIHGTVGKRTLSAALTSAGLPRGEIARIFAAFDGVRKLDRSHPRDTFIAAREHATGHVVAFELATSPVDVWQAKVDGLGDPDGGAPALEGDLRAAKLDLAVDHTRVAVGVAVGDDLRASIIAAGLDDDLLEMLDDALDGHAELSDLRSGARLRIVASEDRVDGAFARYSDLDAVEYFPPSGHAPPVRVYWFAHDDSRHTGGYYDKKGHQPYHGAWRAPIPFARISSRFDMHRLNPVLHVVMPHNGVDFAASIGTPIYAAAAGVVSSAGDSGPCGNMVVLRHDNNLASGYCHMSRFAAGLHGGQHVEARQLIGYVGATGRVTGPHLHFWVKRGDTFIDPLSLRLDGVRVLPPADRDDFMARREDLDQALDAIALPAARDSDASGDRDKDGGEGEMFYEEPP
jgi:murein DD-endopeptidase MepM/ murein hydrolase activator NlpD